MTREAHLSTEMQQSQLKCRMLKQTVSEYLRCVQLLGTFKFHSPPNYLLNSKATSNLLISPKEPVPTYT